MTGKKTPNGRRVHMNVKFSEPEAQLLDKARGEIPRGQWIRATVLKVLNPASMQDIDWERIRSLRR